MIRRALIVVALALSGCGGGDAGPPDAFEGPALIVIEKLALGQLVSDPPGIRCGVCDAMYPECMTDRDSVACEAMFDAGTELHLTLRGQQLYFAIACVADQKPDTKCVFTVTQPMNVTVTGLIAR